MTPAAGGAPAPSTTVRPADKGTIRTEVDGALLRIGTDRAQRWAETTDLRVRRSDLRKLVRAYLATKAAHGNVKDPFHDFALPDDARLCGDLETFLHRCCLPQWLEAGR